MKKFLCLGLLLSCNSGLSAADVTYDDVKKDIETLLNNVGEKYAELNTAITGVQHGFMRISVENSTPEDLHKLLVVGIGSENRGSLKGTINMYINDTLPLMKQMLPLLRKLGL